MVRVYLAGDLVFRPNAVEIFSRLKEICAEVGLEGVPPLDGQIDWTIEPALKLNMAIAEADRDLMDMCEAGLFCLDGFRRSPDMDPGTAVEIGYMFAQGKPLYGYTVDKQHYPEKVATYMERAWGTKLRQRESEVDGAGGLLEDEDGMLVHSDGMVQNAMCEGFIRLSGGSVCGEDDFFKAAKAAASELASLVARRTGTQPKHKPDTIENMPCAESN